MKTADGTCKGVGWITFATQAAMEEAVSWNGCRMGGRSLQISAAKAAHTGFRPSYQAAGTHTPALLEEVLEQLIKPAPNGMVIDATFGRGGHTRAMLGRMTKGATCHAFDMDAAAVRARSRGDLAAISRRSRGDPTVSCRRPGRRCDCTSLERQPLHIPRRLLLDYGDCGASRRRQGREGHRRPL